MKKINKISFALLSVVVLSGCSMLKGNTVVVEENANTVKKPVNLSIQYIVVDKKDKDSLIKNIKDGKGPVITREPEINNTNNGETNNEDNQENNNTDNGNNNNSENNENNN